MGTLHKEIGARMRALREAMRLTQAQVAERAGIETSFYGQVERGANVPSLKTLLAVAEALGASPSDLLPSRGKRRGDRYPAAVERMVAELPPKQQKLVAGLVSDLVGRLKK